MRILIVEDEEPVRDQIARDLLLAGYDCRTAESAREALSLAEREAFDLLLTDYGLPGEDGLWLVERYRSRWPEAAVLMMSSSQVVLGALSSLQVGAEDYLPKPLCAARLERVIAGVRSRRQREKATPYLM